MPARRRWRTSATIPFGYAQGRLWGKTRYSGNGGYTPTDRRYTGQIFDDRTSLYFYNARYYDPLLARFTQADTLVPDPTSPQSFNRYAYVLNNPLKYTDPSGHCATHKAAGDGLYDDCRKQQRYLSDSFGIHFLHPDDWNLSQLQTLGSAFIKFRNYIGLDAWNEHFGGKYLKLTNITWQGNLFLDLDYSININFSDKFFTDTEFTIVHELVHALLFNIYGDKYRFGRGQHDKMGEYGRAIGWLTDGSQWIVPKFAPATYYGRKEKDPEQDFAEVAAALIVGRPPSRVVNGRIVYDKLYRRQVDFVVAFFDDLKRGGIP